MKPSTGSKTLWAELLPHEFKTRWEVCPIVYLPLGLCEPHGQVSAYGLDLIKAEWLCQEAAKLAGGIVAPSMGYHIHETGYHARWLEDEAGEAAPRMTGVPPGIFLHLFLYQLRSFVNAGFRSIVVVSGHSGGNQYDLRSAAEAFMRHVPVNVWVCSDPELVAGQYEGDHAGKYEISQLMYLRPELVDMDAVRLESEPDSGGRLALGADAGEASSELGRQIMEVCLKSLCSAVNALKLKADLSEREMVEVSYTIVETVWAEVLSSAQDWKTSQPWPGQAAVSEHSRWKPYERYTPLSGTIPSEN